MHEHYKYFACGEWKIIADNLHRPPAGGSNDELFAGLFKAARVLIEEGVEEEERIIPTLMLAHKAAWRVPALSYDDVHIEYVISGIPILEQQKFRIRGYEKRGYEKSRRVPKHIQVTLLPHWTAVSLEEVALEYESYIRSNGGACGHLGGRVSYYLHPHSSFQRIDLIVEEGLNDSEGRRWPSPNIVGTLAKAALESLNEYESLLNDGRLSLRLRKRGGSKSPETLIPAMVTLLLSETVARKDGTRDNAEIYRLLNEYVYCALPWKKPLEKGGTTNETRQLWNSVDVLSRTMLYEKPLLLSRNGGLWFASAFPGSALNKD